MTILLSGGGTLGSVTPLLAIAEILKKAYPHARFLWIGTPDGPEARVVQTYDIPFIPFPSGKFRRYVSWKNIIDLGHVIHAFLRAIRLLKKEQVDLCISVGGFVSVPIHWAPALLRRKTWIHQQDVIPGLANRLMARTATIITTALEPSVPRFPRKKTHWIGNPIRDDILSGSREHAQELFGIVNSKKPVVFVTGGGTGAERVNQLIIESLDKLGDCCEIVHLTGRDRTQVLAEQAATYHTFYHPFSFFTTEMRHAYALADIIVSRGGFGTMTEIAACKKAAIFIPKAGHQEENVSHLVEQDAAIGLHEKTTDGNSLAKTIRELLEHREEREKMGQRLDQVLPIADDTSILRLFKIILHDE